MIPEEKCFSLPKVNCRLPEMLHKSQGALLCPAAFIHRSTGLGWTQLPPPLWDVLPQPWHEGHQHLLHNHSHSVKHSVLLNKSTLEAAESWLKLQSKQCSLTCQNMLSIVFPRKPSLPSDDTSLGPRMVINSSKSTWPSPGMGGKDKRFRNQREGWIGRDFWRPYSATP